MDGRLATVLLAFVLPGVLLGVTVWKFASNPLSVLVLVSAMVIGGLYLLSYSETFGS